MPCLSVHAVLNSEPAFTYSPAEASHDEVVNNPELFHALLKKVTACSLLLVYCMQMLHTLVSAELEPATGTHVYVQLFCNWSSCGAQFNVQTVNSLRYTKCALQVMGIKHTGKGDLFHAFGYRMPKGRSVLQGSSLVLPTQLSLSTHNTQI